MKRLLICMLMIMRVMFTSAQVYPYNENFNAMNSFTAPQGWITTIAGFQCYPTHGNNGTQGITRSLTQFSLKDSAISPLIGPLAANSELRFDYRAVETSLYPSFPVTFGNGDKIEIRISANGGAYVPVLTINQSTHLTSTSFATKTVNLSAFQGNNIQVLFYGIKGGSTNDFFVDIDNVIVTNASGLTTINGNIPVKIYPNPVKRGNTISLSGVLSGRYKISIVDLKGKILSENTQLLFDPVVYDITTAELDAGNYFLRLEGETKSYMLRFSIH